MESKNRFSERIKERLKKPKKPLLKFIFSRKMILILLFLLNIFLTVLAVTYLDSTISTWVFTVIAFIAIVIALTRPGSSAFKITWITVIALFPVAGGLFYAYAQVQMWLYRKKRNIAGEIEKSKALMTQSPKMDEAIEDIHYLGPRIQSEYFKGKSFPGFTSTDITYYHMGEEMLSAMMDSMKSAKKYIRMEFFIIDFGDVWDEIHEILVQKVNEGVDVRLIYDGGNMMSDFGRRYAKKLNAEGIKVRLFSPLLPFLATEQNNRDHRKICVVDGELAFTGGANLADEYANIVEVFGVWKDVGIKLTGPAVKAMDVIFMQMWNADILKKGDKKAFADLLDYDKYEDKYSESEESFDMIEKKGLVIPYADSPLDDDYVSEKCYTSLFNTATKNICITTPYFIIDEKLEDALSFAAERGVDVKIIIPHIPDKKLVYLISRSYCKDMIKNGVKVYEYTPGFIHAKQYTADGKQAVVGTANLDFRSLYLHFENGVYMYNSPIIKDIEDDFDETIKQCHQLTDYKEGLTGFERFIGRAGRLFAPLF